MFDKQAINSLRIVCSFGLLGLALIASSCGHTAASPPEVSINVVMKTIHDYGRGHDGLLSPASSAKPDENDKVYCARINNLLIQEDFARLEKIAQQNRADKGRLLGGYWKNSEFFRATGYPLSTGILTDSDYELQRDRIKKWIAAFPECAAARLSLSELYSNYGYFARGSGFSNSVTNSQWKIFHARTAQAKEVLLEAASLKERDPYWYQAMQAVAFYEGWDRTQERELLDQATTFEPGYYHYYRQYALYLQPQWYGKPGDIQAFAEESAASLPEPDSSILYFQIVSSLACYCQQAREDLPHVSYPKVREGYTNLTRLYGTSNLTANRFAFIATTFKDQPSAHEAFSAIVTMDLDIWYTKAIFDDSRTWANSP